MINIKQYTNYDATVEGDYFVIPISAGAFKLGFCGDTQSIGKTIILTINGADKPFEIGKTGMFEYQPEVYKDINSEDQEMREAVVYTTQVKIPKDLVFTLDIAVDA